MSKLRNLFCILYIVATLICSLTLMACGQSGPLYLPPEDNKPLNDS